MFCGDATQEDSSDSREEQDIYVKSEPCELLIDPLLKVEPDSNCNSVEDKIVEGHSSSTVSNIIELEKEGRQTKKRQVLGSQNMPYKIVQTIEGGVASLSVVPAQWERNGLLWWPPKSNIYALKLIKDMNSKPGPGWGTLKCTLKRTNIRTYEEANNELYLMKQNMDTGHQENNCYSINFPETSETCQPLRNEINFEEMAESLTYSQPGVYGMSMKNLEPVQQETTQREQQATLQIISSENSDTMISNQTLILNKLNLILNNQKRLEQKLATLSVQLYETNETIGQLPQEQQCNVTLLKDTTLEERGSLILKPIETHEEFEMFEHNLADKTHKKKLIKRLSTLYSFKPGEGQTCAYKLIDTLLTKEFLCECSWSGGSRGERSKIPLKNFVNFRKFFFDIIHMWDPCFTDDQMLFFFKGILKNANKRRSILGLRESTKRIRKSKNARGQVGNKTMMPEGNNDCDGDHLEANDGNNTEESRTDDNNGKKPTDEDDNDADDEELKQLLC